MADITVGENEFATGKGLKRLSKQRMRWYARIVDGMDGLQEMIGVDAVMEHQAMQRRTMIAVVCLLQRTSLVIGQARHIDHVIRDEEVDLREEIALARIERVVEIEDPVPDMRKAGPDRGDI